MFHVCTVMIAHPLGIIDGMTGPSRPGQLVFLFTRHSIPWKAETVTTTQSRSCDKALKKIITHNNKC